MSIRPDILKASILIVDDKPADISLLELILRGAGYRSVSSTYDSRHVGALQRRNHYDLLLLDLHMPNVDGFQVLADLREKEPDAGFSILVITAHAEHKLRALKAGANDFISKPFEIAEVLTRIHNLLEIRLLQQQLVIHNLARLENSQRIARLGDWEHDFPRQRLLWSEEIYRILGLHRKDGPPDSAAFYRQVHPDDLALVRRQKVLAAEGRRGVDFKHRIVRPNGEVRHIHQITELVFDEQGGIIRETGTLQDITERKETEGHLQDSEQRFTSAFELAPIGMALVSPDGRWLKVNRELCKLVGYSQAELLGRTFQDITHPADLQIDLANVRRMLAGEIRTYQMEKRYIHRLGHAITVLLNVSFVTDDQGRPQYFISQIQDISARKCAEEKLRANTALLEAQMDASIDGILIVDAAGRKILQNQRFITLMKIPPEIAGHKDDQKTLQFVTDRVRHREAFITKVQHLYAHPDETSQDEIEFLDGTIFDRHSSPILSREGKNYGRIWAFRDITANKAAVLALRDSEERFKLVARAVSDVVWDWDFPTNTLWWGAGFLATFGFAAGEIEPGIESWTTRIHPEDRSRVIDSVHQAIAAHTESWSAEYRFQHKDGGYAFVQNRGYILRNEADQATRMVGGMRDLTEQKNREAQQLRAQRLESIGTLAGGIAHDLNNVLAPIMMSIDILKLDASADPRRTRILDIIHRSSRRGAELVRQVLAFAQGMDGQRIVIRLRQVIDDLEGIIRETFPRNIRITSHVADDLFPFMGDPTQLHQVLLNLAVNARDAMPHGGALTLTAANVTLAAPFAGPTPEARTGAFVLLRVADTGEGIPPTVRERIFEPFFTTKEIGKGTGIGLATVHAIVKSHGGFIQVESEVGRGTAFKVYLPADPALAAVGSASPFQADLPRGRNELVLVVDDEFSIREITRQTLEAFGYRVVTAGDGVEAAALYARQPRGIALVITDMMMPTMGGAATIQALQRINPDVRIIAVSGIDSGNQVDQATHAGVHDFLRKPYTAETLLKLLRQVLDQSPGAREP